MLKEVIGFIMIAIIMNESIDKNEVERDLKNIVGDKTSIDELSADELLDIMKILKQHISNAAWVRWGHGHSDVLYQSDFLFLYLTWLYIIISV